MEDVFEKETRTRVCVCGMATPVTPKAIECDTVIKAVVAADVAFNSGCVAQISIQQKKAG